MIHRVIDGDLESIVESFRERARVFEGKTILICGGAGFLGTYFVAVLHRLNQKVLKKPCHVLSVDNYIAASKKSFINGLEGKYVRLIRGDICRPIKITGPVDFIIHAAGLASPVHYKRYPLETIECAVEGTKNLLEYARTKRLTGFLYFSSSEIYGDPDPNFIPTPETYKGNVSSIGPRACYDESKRLGETLCMTYYQLHSVPVKIVRPFNIYGPGMRPNDFRVVPTFIVQGLCGQPLPVHDKGNQTRTFCYITDAMSAFFKVLISGKNGEVYNIGREEEEINMVALANIVAELLDHRVKGQLVAYPDSYPVDEPRRRCPDLTKIKQAVGYRSVVDLRTGLLRMLDWYRSTLAKP